MIRLANPTGLIVGKIENYIADLLDGVWQVVDAKTGYNILEFASFLEATPVHENKVVDEEIEEGSFASYNKVEEPIEVKVILGIEGTNAELQTALNILDTYVKSTDLINCVTPSAEFRNLNLERYDYELKSDLGRGIIYATLHLKEIKQVKIEYTNVKVAPQQKRGTVQTKKVTSKKAASHSSTARGTAPKRSILKSIGNGVRGL